MKCIILLIIDMELVAYAIIILFRFEIRRGPIRTLGFMLPHDNPVSMALGRMTSATNTLAVLEF